MQSYIINALMIVAAIAAYDFFIKVDEVGQGVAVVNYDSALISLGDNPSAESVNAVTEDLKRKASTLSAAGFVVIDSRVLVSYPAENEVPAGKFDKVPQTKETNSEGTPVDPGAFDE
jgi:hypothetical protein